MAEPLVGRSLLLAVVSQVKQEYHEAAEHAAEDKIQRAMATARTDQERCLEQQQQRLQAEAARDREPLERAIEEARAEACLPCGPAPGRIPPRDRASSSKIERRLRLSSRGTRREERKTRVDAGGSRRLGRWAPTRSRGLP